MTHTNRHDGSSHGIAELENGGNAHQRAAPVRGATAGVRTKRPSRGLRITLATMLLLATVPAGGHGPTKGATDPYKAVRDLVQGNATALVRGDLHMLEEAWAKEDVALYEDDIVRAGWREVANHTFRRNFDGRPLIALRVTDIKPRVSRQMAWATFTVQLTEDIRGIRRVAPGVGSAIAERRGNDWKLVHWHVSTGDERMQQRAAGQ